MDRRNFVAVASALALASGTVLAQEFPAKPIHIYVGFAPGGGTDIMTRIVAPRMGERLGQPVIVENKPGAGGNLATEAVAKAAPDGYTLLFTNSGSRDDISAIVRCHTRADCLLLRADQAIE